MTKISDFRAPSDCSLTESLSVIKQTHVQLDVLTGTAISATVLASRIELCDTLLLAISGVRTSLAKDIQRARERPPALN
jgi:hypothetical protein